MGGGAMHIEIPMIHCKTTSPTLPPLPPSGLNYAVLVNNTQLLQQSHAGVSNSSSQTESARGNEDGFYNEIFGSIASQFEVESAISALQNFIRGIWSSESEFRSPIRNLNGFGRIEDAFSLLTSEPIIQKVVFSLSTDKAVWDAVMNNEMVQLLRESYVPQAQNYRIQSFNGESNVIFSFILNWIMHITKAKVTQLIQKFEFQVNQIFKPKDGRRDEESKDETDDRVRSSFILSLIVLFIVVVTRLHET